MIQIGGLIETVIFLISIFSLSILIYVVALVRAIRFSIKWKRILIATGLLILIYEFIDYWTDGEKLDPLITMIFSWIISTVSLYYLIDKLNLKIIRRVGINGHRLNTIVRFILSNLILLILFLIVALGIKIR